MVGHSKWSKVKRIKGPRSVKRGATFSKLKEVTAAARIGVGDLSGNPRLRLAVETARAANMPKETASAPLKMSPANPKEITTKKYFTTVTPPAAWPWFLRPNVFSNFDISEDFLVRLHV